MEISNLAYLQGYLSALAVINDTYDRYITYDFKIEEVDRRQTPLETIISAHQDWEGKHLSHYEYELTLLASGYTELETHLNEWLLFYEANLLLAIDIGEKLSEQRLALRQSIADERLSPCTFFVRALEDYVAEEYNPPQRSDHLLS